MAVASSAATRTASRCSPRCTPKEERAQKLGLTGDGLVEHRRRFIRPMTEQLERWCDAVAPMLLPSEPLMVAVRYYQNHNRALFRFIDDAQVPIDNSATEREFQNVAKLRLNMLFAGSTEGAHRACVLLGIVASCRGRCARAGLSERLGTHREVFGLRNRCTDRCLRSPRSAS